MSSSKMIIPTQNSHITDLSLLLSIVFYCNSSVMIWEHFLSQTLTLLVTVESLTIFFLLTLHGLKMKRSYESLYWDFFFLMSMYLISTGDTFSLGFQSGIFSLLLGFFFVFLHTIHVKWRSWKNPSQVEEEYKHGKKSVSLMVKIGFLFMGNGIANVGRLLLPRNNMVWIFVGGSIWFLVSVMFFCCYYFYSEDQESESPTHLHVE